LSPKTPQRALAGLVLLLGGGTTLGACAEVLGIQTEFESVVKEFCKCDGFDQRWPSDDTGDNFYACEAYVTARLEAKPDLIATWIDAFDTNECDSCSKAEKCANLPPVCVAQGDECISAQVCCDFTAEYPTKSYCGFAEEGDENLVCVADPNFETCRGEGEACEADEECCGSGGLISVCDANLNRCLIACDEVNDATCPGCCALIRPTGSEDPPFGICLSSLPLVDAPECSALCEDECGFNFACTPRPYDFTGGGSVEIATCVEFSQ
jgi:hypothetical protein